MKYDAIVVGAGHAGCEAALASARMGLKTAIFTISLDNIGMMSCNPSVGGPAKGHLVKELDALGGEMGLNTDKTFVQMRMLNTRKGPAVRALRAQSDKKLYHLEMKKTLENTDNLSVIQGLVSNLLIEDEKVKGIEVAEGMQYFANIVILATGTFMRGLIHMGDKKFEGGRMGEIPSNALPLALEKAGIGLGRFKTGTPPRVDGRSVDYSNLIIQPGDKEVLKFSMRTKEEDIAGKTQLPCYLTHTNKKVHEDVKNNLDKSPMYNGEMDTKGPRYCPSIEDKIVKFEGKERHQVFLEPEGFSTNEVYVNGLSTSLPAAVQDKMIRHVAGLENVEIMRWGYAVEYDYILPEEVKYNLETKKVDGLFVVGQINGTTGYEEAAALGMMGGINGALKFKGKDPLILPRNSSYIGMMIDDLITKGTCEPYRVLTARSEYRLLLRDDNADVRLSKIGFELGLVEEDLYKSVEDKIEKTKETIKLLKKTFVSDQDENVQTILDSKGEARIKSGSSLEALLKRVHIQYEDIKKMADLPKLDKEVEYHVETEVKYEGYIRIQADILAKQRKMEDRPIPKGMDFSIMPNISTEAKHRLEKVQPINVGQAARISGVSSSDITFLLQYLKKSL